jgi:hypothetical protein
LGTYCALLRAQIHTRVPSGIPRDGIVKRAERGRRYDDEKKSDGVQYLDEDAPGAFAVKKDGAMMMSEKEMMSSISMKTLQALSAADKVGVTMTTEKEMLFNTSMRMLQALSEAGKLAVMMMTEKVMVSNISTKILQAFSVVDKVGVTMMTEKEMASSTSMLTRMLVALSEAPERILAQAVDTRRENVMVSNTSMTTRCNMRTSKKRREHRQQSVTVD